MNKTDWPYQYLWDLGPIGPTAWLKNHGIDMVMHAGIIDSDSHITEATLSKARNRLFVNQGWRLTTTGIKLFTNCYNHYKAISDENEIMTGRVLINMDNAVRGPWAYRGKTIITFDQIVNFELQIVDGSARSFIEFKKG